MPSNDYYNPTGTPSTGSAGASSPVRAELTLIQTAFNKIAALTGAATRLIFVNAGESAQTTDANLYYDALDLYFYGRKGGYRGLPQKSKSTAYTTVLDDAGCHILHPSADTTARTWTIDSNANVAYEVGTAITFINQNGAGVLTIAITADTMRLAGAGTTGSRTLAANGIATAVKVTSTEWIISGTGLT